MDVPMQNDQAITRDSLYGTAAERDRKSVV